MGYVVGLGLQNPELKIFISIGHSVTEILNIKVREINNFGNNFLLIFFIFVKVLLPIWQLMHKTENKSLWRVEMSYGSDTW